MTASPHQDQPGPGAAQGTEAAVSRGNPILGNLLFALFAMISFVGTYLIVRHFRSRWLAVLLSMAVLVFFVALYFGLEALLQWLGL